MGRTGGGEVTQEEECYKSRPADRDAAAHAAGILIGTASTGSTMDDHPTSEDSGCSR